MQRYVARLGELQEGKKILCTSVSDPDWIQVQLSAVRELDRSGKQRDQAERCTVQYR